MISVCLCTGVFVRPITSELSNFNQFQKDLRARLSEGHVIGFLLDSQTSSLKRSGLTTHPNAVLPLDALLGETATLFYPDPRMFNGREYSVAVREFGQNLLGLESVRFELNAPVVVLMTYNKERFERTEVMPLSPVPMCMWYNELYTFFEAYLKKRPRDLPRKESWNEKIKSHAGAIGIEAISGCVAILLSKIVPV